MRPIVSRTLPIGPDELELQKREGNELVNAVVFYEVARRILALSTGCKTAPLYVSCSLQFTATIYQHI